MGDSVATVSDAAELMYYSALSLFKNQKENNPNYTEQREMELWLKERGIQIEAKNQPIRRGTLARALIERFQLAKSFFTQIFGFESLYYKDAVRLGLFSEDLPSEATLTTRELLQAYLKAESLQKK